METWDAYRSRRNIRDYADRSIDDTVLDRILEAGRRAPSAFNRQPWDFVVVTGHPALDELATVWQGARHVARSAATIAIVTPIEPDPDKARWAEFDLGQAMMAMAVVAADQGVASAHALIGDQQRCRALLGVPEDHRGAYLLALGYPSSGVLGPVDHLDRRPFSEVVHRDRW
jgi:nitroreductase